MFDIKRLPGVRACDLYFSAAALTNPVLLYPWYPQMSYHYGI